MANERIRDENRQRVIRVAQELFISEGVAATSINRIAKEAGLSAMSVYRYFGTKSGLVLAVWRDALSIFYEGYMQRYSKRAEGLNNGYEKCVAAMEEYNNTYLLFPAWYRYTREMLSYTASPEGSGIDMNGIFWQFCDREIPLPIVHSLEEGIADGSVRSDVNIRMLLQLIVNAYTGVDIYGDSENELLPINELDLCSKIIARYIKADT